MFFVMKISKGASKTNLIVNVCICAIKSLHIYRHCVSTCISLLTNTYAHKQVPVYAISCLGKYVQMDCAVCACLQAESSRASLWKSVHTPHIHSACNPSCPAHLPRVSRGTNATLKRETQDLFFNCSFQSLNRVELIKLDFIKTNLMPKGLLQQTRINVRRLTGTQRLDLVLLPFMQMQKALGEEIGPRRSRLKEKRERGGKLAR